ncbi:signal transduction histidine kinase [Massilia sp. UYP11]
MTRSPMRQPPPGATFVDEAEFDTARRRMLAHASLTEYLASPVQLQQVADQLVARMRDDVEAVAIYMETPDGGLTLQSHAGFLRAPPEHAVSAATICCAEFAEVTDLAAFGAARRLQALGPNRPEWVGDRPCSFAAIPFELASGPSPGGLALFFLNASSHDPSLGALLDLCMQGVSRALAPVTGAASSGKGGGAPIRVLLVDDEALLVAHVKRILERAGFAFHSAHLARAGFELAMAIRPDVILIDKVMPDIDGIELLRLMRQQDELSTVPVIMLSGHADEKVRVAALEEGADDFVIKPFSARELVARIEANVRLVRLRRDVVWRQGELLRLQQSQQELRTLLDTVQKVRHDERRILSREVHDQLGQVLTAAKIDIRLLQERLASPLAPPSIAEIRHELASALSSVDMAIFSVQDISALLRPPALEEGLLAALRWQAADIERRANIVCEVRYDDESYVEPASFIAGELLRMCQEALTNVLRHAEATHIVVQVIVRAEHLLVRICDNGIGIRRASLTAPSSIGLRGMRERAASIRAQVRIHGRAGRGTMVVIRRRVAF